MSRTFLTLTAVKAGKGPAMTAARTEKTASSADARIKAKNGAVQVTKKAESETNNTVIRSVIIVPFIIIILIFFSNLFDINKPNQVQTFSNFIESAENAKDREPFMRQLNLNERLIYGFNSESNSITANGKTITKPTTCGFGSCLCLCKEACKEPEETYCKSVRGIDTYISYGLEEANSGGNFRDGQYVALSGSKKKVECVQAERSEGKLSFMPCGSTNA